MEKSIWLSKTAWVAILTEGVILLQAWGEANVVSAQTLAVALPVVFFLLRLITNVPVTLGLPGDSPENK